MKHLYRWYNDWNGLVESIENTAAEQREIVEGTVGFDDESKINKDTRDCKLKWLDNDSLRTMVMNIFHDANHKSFGFNIDYNPSLQYTIYDGNNSEKGNYYNWHSDNAWIDDNYMGDRKLSMVVLLSDPHEYQGGEFHLSDNGVDADGNLRYFSPEEFKKKGDIIIFPSFLNHRVTPVTAGIRKTFVSWVEGPKFR